MFYEMILFCSLAGVVGATISLAEMNTEKARNVTGRSRSPGGRSTTLPSSGTGSGKPKHTRGLCGLSVPPLAAPYLNTGPSFRSVLYSQGKTAWSIKDGCRKARGKGKNSTNGKFKANLALLGKAGAYAEACRFPSSTAAAHKASAAPACSAIAVWTPAAKRQAGRNSERYRVPKREA